MHLEQIKLHVERVPAAIAAVIFGAGAGMFLDVAAYGHIDIDMKPIWMWVSFAGAAISAFICLKKAVFPSLIFQANSSGIKIGRGLIFNRLYHIHWRNLTKIEEGTIKVSVKKSSGRRRMKKMPAVKLVFDESVKLGHLGYRKARPSKRRNFLIARDALRQPLPETIATLKKMKKRYAW